MHSELRIRRKLCIVAQREFWDADTEWHRILKEVSRLVPGAVGRGYWSLGHKGSRVRASYEQRDRALRKLLVAHAKFVTARNRLAGRDRAPPVRDETGFRPNRRRLPR